MSNRELDKEGIDEVLSTIKVCHLGTVDNQGKPYVVPLGYRYVNGAIYLHVADKGEKIDNIRGNPQVCLEVTSMDPPKSMLRSEKWADFASVIVKGRAEKVSDEAEKVAVYGEAGWGAVYKITTEKISGRAWSYQK